MVLHVYVSSEPHSLWREPQPVGATKDDQVVHLVAHGLGEVIWLPKARLHAISSVLNIRSFVGKSGEHWLGMRNATMPVPRSGTERLEGLTCLSRRGKAEAPAARLAGQDGQTRSESRKQRTEGQNRE